MKYKYELKTYKKSCKNLISVDNNFLKEITWTKTYYGYLVILAFKHRHFEIDCTTSDDKMQGIGISYKTDPFKNQKIKFSQYISVENPFKDADMVYEKHKDDLHLLFLKQRNIKFLKNELLMKDEDMWDENNEVS